MKRSSQWPRYYLLDERMQVGTHKRPQTNQVYDIDTISSSYIQSLIVHPYGSPRLSSSCQQVSFRLAQCQIRFQIELRVVRIRYDCENEGVSTLARVEFVQYCRVLLAFCIQVQSQTGSILSALLGNSRHQLSCQASITKEKHLELTATLFLGHRLPNPLGLGFRYQARMVFELVLTVCHLCFGCQRSLVREPVADASDKGSVTEDLRTIVSDCGRGRRRARTATGVRTLTPEEAMTGGW